MPRVRRHSKLPTKSAGPRAFRWLAAGAAEAAQGLPQSAPRWPGGLPLPARGHAPSAGTVGRVGAAVREVEASAPVECCLREVNGGGSGAARARGAMRAARRLFGCRTRGAPKVGSGAQVTLQAMGNRQTTAVLKNERILASVSQPDDSRKAAILTNDCTICSGTILLAT